MKIDLTCSLPHYLEHLLPIWLALPDDMKGDVFEVTHPCTPPARQRIALVGGWPDVQTLRPHHRMIYVEHGAGQSYAGDPKTAGQPGYSSSGGYRHGGVEMFLSPNIPVSRNWKTAPAHAIGCPKMDQYHGMRTPRDMAVCFAWHWDSTISPEARTAWWYYRDRLHEIADRYRQQGFHVYGHAHPRWGIALDDEYGEAGITVLRTDREVFERASILLVDNSSLGMEFMSLGRPVVWLNAPWYRRDVFHGGRFWDWTVGIPTADGPDDLLGMNMWDVLSDVEAVEWRDRHADSAYAHRGDAAQRAADFIAQRYDGK